MTDGAGVPLAPGVAGLESEARFSGFSAAGAAVGVESGETFRSFMGVSSLTMREFGLMIACSRSGDTLRVTSFEFLAAEDFRGGLSFADAAPLVFEAAMALMVGDDFWSCQ